MIDDKPNNFTALWEKQRTDMPKNVYVRSCYRLRVLALGSRGRKPQLFGFKGHEVDQGADTAERIVLYLFDLALA